MPFSAQLVRRRRSGIRALLAVLALGACTDLPPTAPALEPGAPPGRSVSATDLNATPAGHIRIGVVPEASEVKLGAEGSFVVRNKATGATLLTGSGQDVTVVLGSGVIVHRHYRLQVAFTTSAAFRDSWVAKAQGMGYPTYVEPHLSGWRLLIGQFPPNASFSVRNAFRNEVISKQLAWGDSFWRILSYTEGVLQYELRHPGGTAVSRDQVVVEAADGRVRIGGRPYRGRGEVLMNSRGSLAGVNELPLEEYLYGVVPRELPPTIWNELEAQKAQAVAARTYALRGLGKRRGDGYDLLPTDSDQVYGGVAAEHPLSTRAVDETRGYVATHGGRLIEALFSSTSGGHTANNEEVYASSPIAYLRGVPDAERGAAMQHVPTLEVFRNAANPASLRAMRRGDFEADWSRYHRWTFEWSAEEIRRVVSAFAGKDVEEVLAINVLERGPSGRVQRIEYVTKQGTFHDTKDRIRSSLKFINASGGMSSLLSTLFFIEPVTDRRTKQVVGFRAYGGGWGHGVGLCQTGAQGMARRGRSYDEILRHYYQGITLEKRY